VDILLLNLDLGSFRSRDEEEVAGYAEATTLVFDSWRDLQFTENHIKQLHGTLLKFSHRDEHHRGGYKKAANNVEAFDKHGRSVGIVFETASPFDTPRLMQELVGWTNGELEGKTHHPLLVTAVFHVRFLAIHPFQDGNGRLARVLTNLLLLRTGYSYMPYSSLERVIEENREQYYRGLRSAQGTLDKDESRLMDWLRFFILCLVEQKLFER
jgi:Fic family protein